MRRSERKGTTLCADPPKVANAAHPSSFRDPSGFVYRDAQGVLLRQVNSCYAPQYDQLLGCGLYRELVAAGMLIEHEEVDLRRAAGADQAYRVIRPRELTFVTYPYEWCFSALKDAALLTLEIQLRALKTGMTLKDASSYNVQFVGTRPVFIDTLSFARRDGDEPWTAYRQFCQHFLAPLALMAHRRVELGRLAALWIDGIPLDLASSLLPWHTRLRFGTLVHLHLQSRMIRRHSDTARAESVRVPRVPTARLVALLENLRNTVAGLRWRPGSSQWSAYYSATSYSEAGFAQKQAVVEGYLRRVRPGTVWDLGANTGVFSRLAAGSGSESCAFDLEAECTELHYRQCKAEGLSGVTPLILDLANPSGGIGWAHAERQSLAERGPVDLVMALALIHHLAIGNNVPFERIADYFRRLARQLIVEFVPKEDPQVRRLLRGREDVFGGYSQAGFQEAFERHFRIEEREPVGDDGRCLYLMSSKGSLR